METAISVEVRKEIEETEIILQKCESLLIETNEQAILAGDFLKQVKGKYKSLEIHRKAITQPLNKSLTLINQMFNKPKDELSDAERVLKKGLITFNEAVSIKQRADELRLSELARKEEEKRRTKLEEKAKKAELKGNSDQAEELKQMATDLCVPPKESQYEAPKISGTSTRTKWDWRIKDEQKIPRSFLKADDKQLNAIAKSGIKGAMDIAGIEFYSESIMSVRA
jgi:hypothetical protein